MSKLSSGKDHSKDFLRRGEVACEGHEEFLSEKPLVSNAHQKTNDFSRLKELPKNEECMNTNHSATGTLEQCRVAFVQISAGVSAGLFTGFLTNPLDVVKTRLQVRSITYHNECICWYGYLELAITKEREGKGNKARENILYRIKT